MNNLKIHSPHNRNIPQSKKCLLMGILNFTPDSFSDAGEFFEEKKALSHCENMYSQGMDILDLGFESTRPNSIKVSEEEELFRLKKILPLIRKEFPDLLISIDTYKVNVARYAIDNGVDIINDVFGVADKECEDAKDMYLLAANLNVPIIITHNKKINSVDEILCDLNLMANSAIDCGVKKEQIILDYGFGFNKTFEQNLAMQNRIKDFAGLGYPLLVALSRKSTLQKIVGNNREDLDNATVFFFAHSLTKNAVSIFRTHNIAKAKFCLDCIESIK